MAGNSKENKISAALLQMSFTIN